MLKKIIFFLGVLWLGSQLFGAAVDNSNDVNQGTPAATLTPMAIITPGTAAWVEPQINYPGGYSSGGNRAPDARQPIATPSAQQRLMRPVVQPRPLPRTYTEQEYREAVNKIVVELGELQSPTNNPLQGQTLSQEQAKDLRRMFSEYLIAKDDLAAQAALDIAKIYSALPDTITYLEELFKETFGRAPSPVIGMPSGIPLANPLPMLQMK